MDDFIQDFIVWFKALPPIAQFLYVVVAVAATGFIALVYLATKTAATRLGRWIRRKRIPKQIDLKLDRDAKPSQPRKTQSKPYSRKSNAASKKKRYGQRLRKNMERMKKNAPYKSEDQHPK